MTSKIEDLKMVFGQSFFEIGETISLPLRFLLLASRQTNCYFSRDYLIFLDFITCTLSGVPRIIYHRLNLGSAYS